jgi:hypothetical protein
MNFNKKDQLIFIIFPGILILLSVICGVCLAQTKLGTTKAWVALEDMFSVEGTLTFPDGTIQTTAGGAGNEEWTDTGQTLHPSEITDTVSIGTTTTGNMLTVDGDIDTTGVYKIGSQTVFDIDTDDKGLFLGPGVIKPTLSTSDDNYFIGIDIGTTSINNGDGNIGIGATFFQNLTTGDENINIGSNGQENITTGSFNINSGEFGLNTNVSGNRNINFGSNGLFFSTGDDNISIGDSGAGYTGNNNIGIGTDNFFNATTANNNIGIGYKVGDNLTTGDNNILIGHEIDIQIATDSNTLNIGNLIFGTGIDGTATTISSGNIGIGTSTPQTALAIGIGDGTTSGITIGKPPGNVGLIPFSIIHDNTNVFFQRNNSSSSTDISLIRARGSTASPTSVTNSDTLGLFSFRGRAPNGTNIIGASFSADIDPLGTVGNNSMPTSMTFSTVPDGTTTISGRLYIGSTGNIGLGTTTPSSLLHVNGGANTGITINASSGGGCLMFRDTDNAGWTECFTLNGTLTCTIDTDGICDGS